MAAGVSGSAVLLSAGVSRVRHLAAHRPYYWRLLKSLPYGATRRLTGRTCRGYALMEPFVKGRSGLEIGGPSPIFSGKRLIPVYDRCRRIDNVNFSAQTIWDAPGIAAEGGPAFAARYVADATDLSSVPRGTYDFVLASHVLEHVANPLRAMHAWREVLKPGGAMLVIVPDRRATFDHRRPATTFAHIEADFRRHTPESDLTHRDEILALHDLALDPRAGTEAQFRERCRANFEVRAMHHHVFVPEVLVRMFSAVGMRVLALAVERPFHIVVLVRAVDKAGELAAIESQNREFLAESADWRAHDPLRGFSPEEK